jgi:8-oxo-dGTP pyrophosphatase MutT (NUDIX family)
MAKPSFNKSKCYGGIIKCSTTGKYLLVKGFTGKWSFPKGHREKNESPQECAKREIYEETGIVIDDIKDKKATFVSIYYYFNFDFKEEVQTNPIDTNEVKDIKWFLPEETETINKNKDVNVFFSKLLNNIKKEQEMINNVDIKNNIEIKNNVEAEIK